MFSTYSQAMDALAFKAQSAEDNKLKNWCYKLGRLLSALKEKDVEFSFLKEETDHLDLLLGGQTKASQIRVLYTDLTRKIVKTHGFVSPQYYQNQWMALGMTIFGLPFGVLFGMSLGNMAFLGIGLPIGLPIGIAIGQQKDKKAAADGKVLNI